MNDKKKRSPGRPPGETQSWPMRHIKISVEDAQWLQQKFGTMQAGVTKLIADARANK